MDQPLDDLQVRIDQINHEWRQLSRSVDASGIALRRALPDERFERRTPSESWPHQTTSRARFLPRAGATLLLLMVIPLAVIIQRWWPVAPAMRRDVAAEAVILSPAMAPAEPAFSTAPFVIRIRATRPSRVRVVVDGTALDWRLLKGGDEFLARPRQEMLIQSSDAGALSATANGKPISLGSDGQAVALRLTPQGLSGSHP